jgi:hypothetical protein
MNLEITLKINVNVPEGTTLVEGFDGSAIGFKLSDGLVLKPYIVFESQSNADEDPQEISESDLLNKDVEVALDVDKDIAIVEEM